MGAEPSLIINSEANRVNHYYALYIYLLKNNVAFYRLNSSEFLQINCIKFIRIKIKNAADLDCIS